MTLKSTAQIEDVLDLMPSVVDDDESQPNIVPLESCVETDSEKEMMNDHRYAKEKMSQAIENMFELDSELRELARGTESADAYREASNNLKNICIACANLSKMTFGMATIRSERKSQKIQPQKPGQTFNQQNNIVFSGNLDDILNKIKHENVDVPIETDEK
jgi:hypothetical protein